MSMRVDREINHIEYMIQKGKAYCTTIENIGTYVIASARYFANIKEKIEHENITDNNKQNADDFVVWYPVACEACEAQCIDSPWGIGKPSANLYVRCMY